MNTDSIFHPPVPGQLQPIELGCIEHANVALWGHTQIWPAMGALQRLMVTDKQAPLLLSSLVHQSYAQRSSALVDTLKTCLAGNQSVNHVIQEIGLSLKSDRLARCDATKNGDSPGVEAGAEVVYRTVEDAPARARG
jgi:hypothetical protein